MLEVVGVIVFGVIGVEVIVFGVEVIAHSPCLSLILVAIPFT